jgi:3-deoxy-D-manno-octulosonic-acid transferase
MLGLVMLAYLPVFLVRRLRGSGYERSLAERFGRYGHELPAEPRCWIHAVSVGEAATLRCRSSRPSDAAGRSWPWS